MNNNRKQCVETILIFKSDELKDMRISMMDEDELQNFIQKVTK